MENNSNNNSHVKMYNNKQFGFQQCFLYQNTQNIEQIFFVTNFWASFTQPQDPHCHARTEQLSELGLPHWPPQLLCSWHPGSCWLLLHPAILFVRPKSSSSAETCQKGSLHCSCTCTLKLPLPSDLVWSLCSYFIAVL